VKLLDCIAQSRAPLLVAEDNGAIYRLTSACDFSGAVEGCPLRWVLQDDLTRTCAEIAYSDGQQLSDCLDLLRVPAQRLWVEWADEPRRSRLWHANAESTAADGSSYALRAGALIEADCAGRRGVMRTFWTHSARPDEPLVGALETHFDFEGSLPHAGKPADMFEGRFGGVTAALARPLDSVLTCVRYRFDPSWLKYYRQMQLSNAARDRILRDSLATVANDWPLLLALLLLLACPGELQMNPLSLQRLNAKRRGAGRPALLEHVEVSAPVLSSAKISAPAGEAGWRRGPRFHHVRGHLVRRGDALYWRAPHWRGHVRLGRIKSRTVLLHS
jgi:hypothetical protein